MIKRSIKKSFLELKKKYPVLALTGPRQSGKSTLLRQMFPQYEYVNLESPSLRDFATTDPESFFKRYSGKVILDEVQNVPPLFSFLQVMVDEKKKMGDFILSGSSQFKLREQLSQSLAGRVSIFNLLPLSVKELAGSEYRAETLGKNQPFSLICRGFYPALFDRKIPSSDYYADYLQTYVEKDVRTLLNIRDLKTFHSFLKLCAGRVGSVINYTSLGNDAGVSRETIKTWLHILETSFITYEISPYFKNFNKRIVKSPKLYFHDVGLLCYLLGITADTLESHPLRGGIFENFIISELMKEQYNTHKTPEFYFYRDSSGLEVDLVIPHQGKLKAFEIKSSRTYSQSFLHNLKKWKTLAGREFSTGAVIYAGDAARKDEGFEIIPWGVGSLPLV